MPIYKYLLYCCIVIMCKFVLIFTLFLYYVFMINPTVKSMLLANINIDEYNPLYRKTILVNLILMASVLGFGSFALLNIFILSQPLFGLVDFVSFLISAYGIYSIRKRKDIKVASTIASINLFVFLLLIIYLYNGDNFTLIWTIFLPITVILVNGSKRGLIISSIFYTIVFLYTYTGIGIWQNGAWNINSFARFVGASLILVYIIYFFEQSFEKSYIVLKKTRDKEKEYVNKLQVCSVTDPLTDLFNRRQLDYLFDKNFDKAEFHKSHFAFFILDLDDFKLYNDTYGHIKGDEVLQVVATTLKKNMQREVDNVFRLGGEEFCGLLMADSSSKVFKSIEKIRMDIENLRIAHEKSSHGVITGSFGICIIDNYKIKSFDEMYKIADEYLYKAKQNGRNCVLGSTVALHLTLMKAQ